MNDLDGILLRIRRNGCIFDVIIGVIAIYLAVRYVLPYAGPFLQALLH